MSVGCRICPRECGADRNNSVGLCGGGKAARIAKTVDPFFYEEPCLGDLAAVFFGGCSLRCSYCQNIAISRGQKGEEYSVDMLTALFDRITSNNRAIDLVTPTHYLEQIENAVNACNVRPRIIYNTSGYETEDAVARAAKFTDVFLTDFKYGKESTAARLSAAPDYPTVAAKALESMRELTPDIYETGDDGDKILKRGLVVRHLVLPGETDNSIAALDMIKQAIGTDVIISLMSQFTPNGVGEPKQRLKKIEYKLVCEHARKLGFTKGYYQEFDSASSKYTPDFGQ
ncbi:MAG: radical SAM protein [Clostridiales bacterium]|nr:radical SAM protein [Clostridiales bacterium]